MWLLMVCQKARQYNRFLKFVRDIDTEANVSQ